MFRLMFELCLPWIEVQKMPLQFEAGEQFSYNATNYLLLEKADGVRTIVIIERNKMTLMSGDIKHIDLTKNSGESAD